jgi:Ca2+-binding EF-hand superfamily protein
MKIVPAHQLKHQPSEQDIKQMLFRDLSRFDLNKDNLFDIEELTIFFQEIIDKKGLGNKHNAREMAIVFLNILDMDGDGKLSRSEIYAYYKE